MPKRSKFTITFLLGILFLGMWLLFVAEVSADELSLGVASAALAVLLNALVWLKMDLRFSPTWRHVLSVWRLPWDVLRDAWEISVILLQELAGNKAGSFFRVTPFRSNSTREGNSQIILATAYTTASPNFIVIGACDDQLLFHQIKRTEVPRIIAELEAEA